MYILTLLFKHARENLLRQWREQ